MAEGLTLRVAVKALTVALRKAGAAADRRPVRARPVGQRRLPRSTGKAARGLRAAAEHDRHDAEGDPERDASSARAGHVEGHPQVQLRGQAPRVRPHRARGLRRRREGGRSSATRRGEASPTKLPGIGEPGAEKILLFSGRHALLAPESNALRVLVRLGLVREGSSYARTYAAARAAAADLSPDVGIVQEAHLLLQQHGQTLCKRSAPLCAACPLENRCAYARPKTRRRR